LLTSDQHKACFDFRDFMVSGAEIVFEELKAQQLQSLTTDCNDGRARGE